MGYERKSKLIKTHTSQSVNASSQGITNTNWIKADGYSQIGVLVNNHDGGSTPFGCFIHWSPDGVTTMGGEYVVTSSPATSGSGKSSSIPVKMPYFKLAPYNGDGATHTYSVFAYLTGGE